MSPEAASLLEWGKVLLGFLGPIMVVIVTKRQDRSQKLRDMEEEAKKKERDQRDEKVNESLEKLTQKVDRIDKDLSSVKATVEEMERMDTKVHTDLAMLNRYHEVNVKHIQKVSSTIIQIGEGLRDNSLDGKLTKSISDLQSYEASMYAEIFGHNQLASDGKG